MEFEDDRKKVYGLGNERMKGKWCQDKIVMDMECFVLFWKYHMLNYGLDLFSRQENTAERTAIMEVEGETPEAIQHVIETQPGLYA